MTPPEVSEPAPEQRDDEVAALLRERHGYVIRGLTDRVAAVDEQLAARGASPPPADPAEPAAPPPADDPRADAPRAAGRRPRQTREG